MTQIAESKQNKHFAILIFKIYHRVQQSRDSVPQYLVLQKQKIGNKSKGSRKDKICSKITIQKFRVSSLAR